MNLDDIKSKVPLSNIKGDFTSLVLFGSYSRGDFEAKSDIDVLQISNESKKHYSFGQVNVSIYTMKQLSKMATEGNLFLLHVINEGKVISGDTSVLNYLSEIFKSLSNYEEYRKDILITAKILDTKDKEEYFANWDQYNNLICFLFRSYLYSCLYDKGNLVYSIKEVSRIYNDERIAEAMKLKKIYKYNYQKFLEVKHLFESYSNIEFVNEYKSLQELEKGLSYKPELFKSMISNFEKESDYKLDY